MTLNVLNNLDASFWDKHCFAHNYLGVDLLPGCTTTKGTIINKDYIMHGAGFGRYYSDKLRLKLDEVRPQVLVILLDTFMLMEAGFMNADTSPASTIFYYPTDGGGGLPRGCENILRKCQHSVCMSRFGQKQVKKYYGIDSDYIPHSINTDIYFKHPKEKIEKLKKMWGFEGKFVVGCVQRNQPRKMPDRLIKSFAKFAKIVPDAILLMHTDPNDPAGVFSIQNLIRRYNIENRVYFTGMSIHKPFDLNQMNDLYNIFDIFTTTSSGEGFGMPILEAMATGVPVVTTDYTTTRELIDEDGFKCGIPVRLAGCDNSNIMHTDDPEYDFNIDNGTITGSWDVERGIVDINGMCEAFMTLYQDKNMCENMGKDGIAKVKKFFTNEVIMPQWEKVLRKQIKW